MLEDLLHSGTGGPCCSCLFYAVCSLSAEQLNACMQGGVLSTQPAVAYQHTRRCAFLLKSMLCPAASVLAHSPFQGRRSLGRLCLLEASSEVHVTPLWVVECEKQLPRRQLCVLLGLVWLLLAQAVLIRTDSHRGEESLCGGGPEGEGAGPQLGHRH